MAIRVGVVGVGFGQNVHVPAFRADPRAEVTAICASSKERARAVAARLEIPKAYGDWRALVRDREIDVVSIAVPPLFGPEIAREAAREQKHLFCEKPLALDARQSGAMLSAAKEARVVHAVDFEFMELESFRRAQALLNDGAIGRLRHFAHTWRVEIRAYQTPGPEESWKVKAELGGGALGNFTSHVLYFLEAIFGRVERLAARLEYPAGPGPDRPAGSSTVGPADARNLAWLEHQGGFSGELAVSTDAFLGSGHRLEVYGDAGTLVLENSSADHLRNFVLSLGTRKSGRLEVIADERKSGTEGGPNVDGRIAPVASLARRFLDAVLGGAIMRPSLEDGHRVQVLMEEMREAHRSGAWRSV